MKIVGIQSSPRGKNSNTLKLLNAALEGAAAAGAETELINVAKLKIKYCTACNACHKTGVCAIKDDYQAVLEKLMAADGIVLSSPDYICNITAQLKTLFDRSPMVIHEQSFDGKHGFSLTTAGSGGEELDFVLGVMNRFLTGCGATSVGGVGCSASQGPAAMEAAIKRSNDMGKDLVAAIGEKRQYPEQETIHKAMKERFAYLVTANKDEWKHNYQHWIEKGWIKA